MKSADHGAGASEDCGAEPYAGKLAKEVIVDGAKHVESENEACETKVVMTTRVVGACGNSATEVLGPEVGCGCAKANNNPIALGNEETPTAGDRLSTTNLVNDCLPLLIV